MFLAANSDELAPAFGFAPSPAAASHVTTSAVVTISLTLSLFMPHLRVTKSRCPSIQRVIRFLSLAIAFVFLFVPVAVNQRRRPDRQPDTLRFLFGNRQLLHDPLTALAVHLGSAGLPNPYPTAALAIFQLHA